MEKKIFAAMLFVAAIAFVACNKNNATPETPTVVPTGDPIGDKTVQEAVMGDYLMSDGSILNQETELTADLASKIVGLVFYAGHHEDDLSDYSTSGIGQKNCNGYAVALTNVHNDDVDRIYWAYNGGMYKLTVGTGDSSGSNWNWNGYYNSRKFHECVKNYDAWEMDDFRAAHACETYGNRTIDQLGGRTTDYEWQKPLTAPSSTSGWFLPSIGQLERLLENRITRNTLVSLITTVQSSLPDGCAYKDKVQYFDLEGTIYWASTESDASNAFGVYLENSGVYARPYTKSERFSVRAVLAF